MLKVFDGLKDCKMFTLRLIKSCYVVQRVFLGSWI